MIVVTAERDDDRARRAVKKQFAFYGSTPAYRLTLDCHGAPHPEPAPLSSRPLGRYRPTHDDTLLDGRGRAPAKKVARAGLSGRGSRRWGQLTNNRAPDLTHWATPW
jgi:hypothetical protein